MIDTCMIKTDELAEEYWLPLAKKVLEEGGLIGIPTETVYGLAGNALDPLASQKIYAAKGRPSDNPLIVHIADMEMLPELVKRIPETAVKIADAFWPGPLTIIMEKSEIVPYETTGGLDTVAIRMPSHPIANRLIGMSRIPLAAPSANTSGRPSPTRASHVYEDLNGKIEMILDGGDVGIGIESTIIDVTGDTPMILRPGYITKAMLEEVVGTVLVDPAVADESGSGDFRPKAPGMKYKHYAPKGELKIISGEQASVVEKIIQMAQSRLEEGASVGIIATDETEKAYDTLKAQGAVLMNIGTRKDEDTIIHNLFDVLRRMDGAGVKYIFSESFEEGDRGMAIMNRLLKAAGYDRIFV